MKQNKQQNSHNQQPFRRPESILRIVLVIFVIFYVWVTLNYFLAPPTSNQTTTNDISTTTTATKIEKTIPVIPVTPVTPKTPEIQANEKPERKEGSLRSNNQINKQNNNQNNQNNQNNLNNQNNVLKPKNTSLNDLVTAVVECSTTHGDFIIDVRGNWAPLGSQRFLELVKIGFFEDLPFFRVCPRYITQFGVKYDWNSLFQPILDDPTLWNKRTMNFGYVFFAGSGANSRNDQMVISFCQTEGCKLAELGKADWEVPLGTIRRTGFNTLVNIEKTGFPYPSLEMGGLNPNARGPDQFQLRSNANYLKENYPKLAYWKECNIIEQNIEVERPLTVDYNLETGALPYDFNRYKNNLIISPTITGKETNSIYVEFLIVLNGNNNPNEPSMYLAQRVVIEIIPQWSPRGAKRFLELVETLYFDNAAFFRVIKGFMAQFGISPFPDISSYWRSKIIEDDPVLQKNSRGTISFATSGPNSRTSQLFINFVNNFYLDKEGFTPIGRIVEGMETVIDNIYYGYGEGGSGDGKDGKGPSQGRINNEGQKYLDNFFPKLSYIKYATILENYTPPKQ